MQSVELTIVFPINFPVFVFLLLIAASRNQSRLGCLFGLLPPWCACIFLLQHRVAIATCPGCHGNDSGRIARCNPQTSRSEARFELREGVRFYGCLCDTVPNPRNACRIDMVCHYIRIDNFLILSRYAWLLFCNVEK